MLLTFPSLLTPYSEAPSCPALLFTCQTSPSQLYRCAQSPIQAWLRERPLSLKEGKDRCGLQVQVDLISVLF